MVSEPMHNYNVDVPDSSLNPCFSGRWFRSFITQCLTATKGCLNPCFSGRWFRSADITVGNEFKNEQVLILVLVEDGFGE